MRVNGSACPRRTIRISEGRATIRRPGLNAYFVIDAAGALTGDNLPLLVVIAAFGALLPDLDAEQSKLKSISLGGVQPFAVPAIAIHRAWGHRGFLHSLAGLGLVGLVAAGLGVSWGGALAQQFAFQNRRRCRRLHQARHCG